ncbi:DNA topoisomerase IV subunit A [Lapidilactobacillus concavus DSM 17758]|uniref:DNA topoisomerase 4 subunit A n=2 Tax=Lapidilactobacillus TaxID=2767884 RepID=A0A0R1VY66_9LACO|nr:DNA topoisomerase IV subunit A [Lapidilactobacillus concavus DSM 17758]
MKLMAEDTQKIEELSLETVMGERFSRYSKYIIQERALPDIRDGLKPVQRRILFAMNQDGNTYDHAFRKSAKSVGNIMGNFHPHGDSSIYESMVRMSQDWKLRQPLIEMHGNNGSMDGDPPAAMRYTEARLSHISTELLRDIDKDTVNMVLNFDDTTEEPTVLPAHFPNLLVNGSSGISAGYATEIPPHNLGEVIDTVIYLMDHPDATLDELMKFVPGPDFPTGGILQGIDGIKQAYQTGRGRVVLRSKTAIEELRSQREQIVITELPYEVNKALLVKKIDELRLMKKVDGISEVRDETDRTGLRVVIELKRNADAQGISNYLFKNTDLQISYNFNMVAIADLRPQQIGLKQALTAYLAHQRDVMTRRTKFDLAKAQKRQHIVEGLIRALSILDEVIRIIRGSKNKGDAKQNLMSEYQFSEIQAEAIVSLQLYRLTNTDVTALEAEHHELSDKIAEFQNILNDAKTLDRVIIKDLKRIKRDFPGERLTTVEREVESLDIDTSVMVTAEDVQVMVSHDGYLKRSSLRSFQATDASDNGLKDEDYPVFMATVNTLDHLFIFTTKGNLIYRPIHEIDESKWKDMGQHLSQDVGLASDESVLAAYVFKDLKQVGQFVLVTSDGYIKQVAFESLLPGRTYRTRPQQAIKLKDEASQVIGMRYLLPDEATFADTYLFTKNALGIHFSLSEVPVVGAKAAGVKAANLKDDDELVAAIFTTVAEESTDNAVGILTQRGAFKKMPLSEIPLGNRARRGLLMLRILKRQPHEIVAASLLTPGEQALEVTTDQNQKVTVTIDDVPLNDRYSNGSFILDPEQSGLPIRMTKLENDAEA